MTPDQRPKKLLQKQPSMRRMMLALLPCLGGSVYFFGWRALAVVAVACAVGFVAEWLFCRRFKQPVSEAVFVTGTLYALVMPPTVPWHVGSAGSGGTSSTPLWRAAVLCMCASRWR